MMLKNCLILVLLSVSAQLWAGERLSILSPHRKSLQREYIPAFKEYYKKTFGRDIAVEWIDQGGTENDLRYIKNKFSKNSGSSGIDVFWGGGDLTFQELDEKGFLAQVTLPKKLVSELQEKVAGIRTISEDKTWYATAISSFGIFYNKFLQKKLKLPAPESWDSLASPKYMGHLSVADPRHSSSSLTMFLIMLYSEKWEKSWQTISSLAGNVREFSLSSSQPVKDVVSGDATFATAIDFYATAKISSLGRSRLGFVLPPGKTVFNADPAGVLKGAPNRLQAERFLAYLLQSGPQQKLILPKGHPQGPRWATLGRMAVNKKAYLNSGRESLSQNPFELASPEFSLDLVKMARIKSVLKDLIGAVYIDLHPLLRKAWARVNQRGPSARDLKRYWKPPVTEARLEELATKWDNQALRNQVINAWISRHKKLYTELARAGKVADNG